MPLKNLKKSMKQMKYCLILKKDRHMISLVLQVYIHKQLVAERDKGKAVLLVSLELDEVMSLADRILVMYEGEIVGELDPKTTTVQELGLYMAGAKRTAKEGETA